MSRLDEVTDAQRDFVRMILRRAIDGGETQSSLARSMGTTQQHVSRMLSGESRPTLNMVTRLARAGFVRLQPFLSDDLEGADPTAPAPATLSASDAERLRFALATVRDVLSRLA